MHFYLNGQGNQPELMSYVPVLLFIKKSEVKIKEVGTVPLEDSKLFCQGSHSFLLVHLSEAKTLILSSKQCKTKQTNHVRMNRSCIQRLANRQKRQPGKQTLRINRQSQIRQRSIAGKLQPVWHDKQFGRAQVELDHYTQHTRKLIGNEQVSRQVGKAGVSGRLVRVVGSENTKEFDKDGE